MFNIDEMGPTAIDLLVADPNHRVVRRGIHTSLIHFTDHRLLVFNNADIRAARQVCPSNPRWNYDKETYTNALPTSTYVDSHFSSGHAVNARTHVRDPTAKFPDAPLLVHVAIDTYSDVSISHADIAYNITDIEEIIRTGGGQSHFTQQGYVDICK
jgi:hypothetical protein